MDLNVTAAQCATFGRATINGNDEGVGARRLIIILDRHAESARYTIVGARATECG